ncbi:hypothetical protein RvY_15243 [Ramazzottius varieornatus]|uniref:Uncharacterized protein n=1 Tax=Ramazzottius varieornatus TaxID=947166 RepID=A0A1D1VU73_RAMVA|nr:hypothetical protein RvY_15243 [Ramazzottius varieornatus]
MDDYLKTEEGIETVRLPSYHCDFNPIEKCWARRNLGSGSEISLYETQIPAILEPPGIFRKDKRRPDGMTQVPWKNGKELVWDVTGVNTLALTNFAMSTVKAGSAADAAEKRKVTKYPDIGNQFLFCPVGLETLGPREPCATEMFESVGRQIVELAVIDGCLAYPMGMQTAHHNQPCSKLGLSAWSVEFSTRVKEYRTIYREVSDGALKYDRWQKPTSLIHVAN